MKTKNKRKKVKEVNKKHIKKNEAVLKTTSYKTRLEDDPPNIISHFWLILVSMYLNFIMKQEIITVEQRESGYGTYKIRNVYSKLAGDNTYGNTTAENSAVIERQ